MPNSYNLAMLPSSVWYSIISYLSPADLQNLMMVNHLIKSYVQRYLYNELTLTEWASSGKRLALAIKEGVVSQDAVGCTRIFRIKFTSYEEISETLQLCLDIQPQMTGVQKIEIESHKTEDAFFALKVLIEKFKVSELEVTARAAASVPLHSRYSNVLECITVLRLPTLFRSDIAYLHAIQDIQVEDVVDDNVNVFLNNASGTLITRIAMRYRDYVLLNSPSCQQLELILDKTVTELRIDSPSVRVLRLVATTDLPDVEPIFRTPCLNVLILCNIAPLPTMRLFRNNKLTNVEFISLAPVTIPALQALAATTLISTLKLVLAMVMHTSFLSESPQLQRRETRRLVEWLQTIASTYPVDVRDFSHLLKREIYFSEGLWCLAAQTLYREYLPLVAPPPLINE